MKKLILTSALALLAVVGLQAQTKWTATWATAIEAPLAESDMPKTSMTNSTLRQVIHVSIGGDKLRMQLSNEKSQQPVEIKSVYIADTDGGKAIDAKTAKYLTFNSVGGYELCSDVSALKASGKASTGRVGIKLGKEDSVFSIQTSKKPTEHLATLGTKGKNVGCVPH